MFVLGYDVVAFDLVHLFLGPYNLILEPFVVIE